MVPHNLNISFLVFSNLYKDLLKKVIDGLHSTKVTEADESGLLEIKLHSIIWKSSSLCAVVENYNWLYLLIFRVFQVYEYGTVIKDVVDIHYPLHEMACNSKIRCVIAAHCCEWCSCNYYSTYQCSSARHGDFCKG